MWNNKKIQTPWTTTTRKKMEEERNLSAPSLSFLFFSPRLPIMLTVQQRTKCIRQ